jgi:hypothetical protein
MPAGSRRAPCRSSAAAPRVLRARSPRGPNRGRRSAARSNNRASPLCRARRTDRAAARSARVSRATALRFLVGTIIPSDNCRARACAAARPAEPRCLLRLLTSKMAWNQSASGFLPCSKIVPAIIDTWAEMGAAKVLRPLSASPWRSSRTEFGTAPLGCAFGLCAYFLRQPLFGVTE